MRYTRSMLYGPDGSRLWSGEANASQYALDYVPSGPVKQVLAGLLPSAKTPQSKSCTRGDVIKATEKMEYVTRDGCPKGFVHLLPRCVRLNERVMAYNWDHLAAFRPAVVQPSNIFDLSDPETQELTKSFEESGQMFGLAAPDDRLRLGYATDPMLFKWLRGKMLKDARLPYAVFTRLPGFRRIHSGSIGGLDRLRQYEIPDLHVLCRPEDALDLILTHFEEAAKVARAWFGDEFAHFIDVVHDMGSSAIHAFATRAARAMNQFTLVNILGEQPRYYSFRSGLMVDGGYGNVMLHNTQWDQENGRRFRILTEDGTPVSIIHATVAGGAHKLLPLFVGRGIGGLGSRNIPLELAPVQVLVLPVSAEHRPRAEAFADELSQSGIPAALLAAPQSLSKRMNLCRKHWDPCIAVIGEKEIRSGKVSIESTAKAWRYPTEEFVAAFGARIRQGHRETRSFRFDLPY